MKFYLESIKQAQKLYTGPDFPKLVSEYKIMGIVTNIYNIETGIVSYVNKQQKIIRDTGIKVDVEIPQNSNYEKAILGLKRNQKGESDFITFCREVAGVGIYKWIVDLENMTCNYYDKQENMIISEIIPQIK